MQEDFVKIINATYKLLEFFPENDPLKNKAKERALMIMENLTVIYDIKSRPTLLDNIAILENYLELAKYQGWISAVNFLIIKKEWQGIKIQQPAVISSTKPIYKNDPPEDYSDRQKQILTLMGKREKVQVRDIIQEMPKVTKRTIRRDLDNLLKKGKITRIGEFNQVFYQQIDRTHFLS